VLTVGEVAALGEARLVALLGRAAGRQLHALAHNRDPRPVRRARRRSIGAQRALGRRARSREELDAVLVGLVDGLGRRLRRARRVCRTVVLRIRFGDFARVTRSHTLPEATAQTHAILDVARGLLVAARPLIERRGITLLGVSLTSLARDCPAQLALPLDPRAAPALDAAVDGVRERFGSGAITRAVLLGREQSPSVPILRE
jgi:DNA polymerase-4